MKHILFSASLLLISATGFAQSIPVKNWCGTAQRMNELRANPKSAAVLEHDDDIRTQEANNHSVQFVVQ